MEPMVKRTVLLTALVAAAYCSSVQNSPTSGQMDKAREQPVEEPKLTALFDFGHYAQRLRKVYSSRAETIARKIYFLASSLQVYMAAVDYNLWRRSSYLALNYLSDWSPQELEMMENKILASDGQTPAGAVDTFEAPQDVLNLDEMVSLEHELEREIESRLEEGELKASAQGERTRRKKRHIQADSENQNSASRDQMQPNKQKPPRPLPMNKLIRADEPMPVHKLAAVESNNPKYDRLALETDTMGLVDEQEDVAMWDLRAPEEGQKGRDSSRTILQLISSIADRGRKLSGPGSLREDDTSGQRAMGEESGNEMFVDLSQGGCMLPVGKQGKCGCCYAFVAVALAEYYYCKRRGHLVAFSPQYMVDCGNGLVEGMFGCKGATIKSVPKFIHNFGLELPDHMPYLARNAQCPYQNDTDLSTTGFIRMRVENFARIHSFHWPDRLKYGPIMLQVAKPTGFGQYAGGVDQGEGCGEKPTHAMLLVGHGREDGHEFWLIRNSYGPQWGERGHWKLAKSATERCLYKQLGYVFGSKDGREFEIEPRTNLRHRETVELLRASSRENGTR